MSNDTTSNSDPALLHPCPTCGSAISFDVTPTVTKANLDFLLAEMRQWQATNSLPPQLLSPLMRHYTSWREWMDRGWASTGIDLPAVPPIQQSSGATHFLDAVWPGFGPTRGVPQSPRSPASPADRPAPSAPSKPPPPKPSPVHVVTEFLEARNIAALHVVGSLLLLTGLFVLVRLQWEAWGKSLLLSMLVLMTAGLSVGGRRLSDRDPVGGLILSGLGALILPLNFVALYLFGFLSGIIGPPGEWSGNITGLVGSLCSGGVYAVSMQRTRHPLFATLCAVAGAFAALFVVRLLPSSLGGFAYAIGFLPLAQVYFHIARRFYRAGEERLAQPFAWTGHGMMVFAVVFGLLANPDGQYATVQKGLLAALCAGIYADAAIRLRIPWLAYVAALATIVASQLLIGWDSPLATRGMMIAFAALVLCLVGHFLGYRASRDDSNLNSSKSSSENSTSSDKGSEAPNSEVAPVETELREVYEQAREIYYRTGDWMASAVIGISALALGYELLLLNLAHTDDGLPQKAITGLVAGAVCLDACLRGAASRSLLYRLFAALFVVTAAVVGMVAHAVPDLTWLIVPGVAGLLWALLVRGLASLLPRSEPLYLTAANEVVGAITVLFTLVPWCYINPDSWGKPPPFREAHLWLVLPGFALLSGGTAWWAGESTGDQIDVRERNVHLTALSLGSLALYVGASANWLPVPERLLWAALGGSLMAGIWCGVVMLLSKWREALMPLAADAQALALISFLPLISFATEDGRYVWPVTGILLLLTLVWTLVARLQAESRPLYRAGAMLLCAAWIISVPLDRWATGWGDVPGHLRAGGGLLVAAPVLFGIGQLLRRRRTGGQPDYASPVFHVALTAMILGGIGQTYLAFCAGQAGDGALPLAAAGVGTLWLMAVCLALYGWLPVGTKRPECVLCVHAALVPLLCGYMAYLSRHGIGNEYWLLSPRVAASVLALVGGVMLADGARRDASLTMQGGVSLVTVAYLHMLGELLPPSMHYAWALALLPLFIACYCWKRDALRRLLLPTGFVILLAYLIDVAFFALYHEAPYDTLRIYLLCTSVAYAGLLLADAIVMDDAKWLKNAMAISTLCGTLWVAGYPQLNLEVAQVGLTLAVIGGFWYGATLMLRSWRPALVESMTRGALLIAGVGGVAAFAGASVPEMLWYSVAGLVLTCAFFILRARQLPQSPWKHLAFAAGFATFGVCLQHAIGLRGANIDLYFLPLGGYLLLLGGRTLYRCGKEGSAKKEGTGENSGAAQSGESDTVTSEELDSAHWMCGVGLILLLTPTLLSAIFDPGTWWHPFLLVAESLLAIVLGIAYRLRVFTGFGLAFLVALLGIKAYQPGQEKSFAFYLTILGALILVISFAVDRYRRKREGKG